MIYSKRPEPREPLESNQSKDACLDTRLRSGKKKVKGRTMELTDFLSEGGKQVQAGYAVIQKKIDWSDENSYTPAIHEMVLPTAPMSSRGGRVDDSKVPTDPPYTAYLGNLPFDVGEEEIANFFHDMKISEIRLTSDSANRPKGFGYIDFSDRRSLIDALNMDGEQVRSRPIRVGLPNDVEDGKSSFFNRDRSGYGARGDRGDRPERDLGTDWRASRKEDGPSMNRGSDDRGFSRAGDRYGDRYGDRDRGGFSDRDRGNFGDRDEEMNRDWRSSEGRGAFERDNRDRGGFGNRYEPPRDSRDSRDMRDMREPRSDDAARSERPKLNLAPRTKPVNPIQVTPVESAERSPEPARSKIEKPKSSDIFGSAKPVDTAAREREIEAKLEAAQAKAAEYEEKEKQAQQQVNENNNEPAQRNPLRQEKSWRDESREEKEKRQRDREGKVIRVDRKVPAPQQQQQQQQNEDEPVVMTSRNKFADLEDADGVACESDGEGKE